MFIQQPLDGWNEHVHIFERRGDEIDVVEHVNVVTRAEAVWLGSQLAVVQPLRYACDSHS